jgi:hypothetical protein
MTTRAEQSRINGRKARRKPKTPLTREFPDLDNFRWHRHEAVPEFPDMPQHSDYLSVEHVRRGRWQSVWIQKPVQLADTEPRNGEGI